MAAASNESFGLKIATASSIALAVVLLVSVYFINSERLQATEKLAAAEKKVGETSNQLRTATEQANEYRTRLGYGPIEDYEAAIARSSPTSRRRPAPRRSTPRSTTRSASGAARSSRAS